ncbi:MAG: hypothetical protein ABII00_16340 [Elusimicrobiota bacterium]
MAKKARKKGVRKKKASPFDGTILPPIPRITIPREVREALPEPVDPRLKAWAEQAEVEVIRDRIGFDVSKEVTHFSRNLGLSGEQKRRVTLHMSAKNRLLREHATVRRAHREKTFALHRQILALNRKFDKMLKRMEVEEDEVQARVRKELRPDQKKQYDLLLQERDRIEKEWLRSYEKRVRELPPPRGNV